MSAKEDDPRTLEFPLDYHIRNGLISGTVSLIDRFIALSELVERKQRINNLVVNTYYRNTEGETPALALRHRIYLNWGVHRVNQLEEQIQTKTKELPVFVREELRNGT